MPDLSTEYLGFRLRTPLVASASPLSEQVDDVRRLEDAGAAAVVLYSMFAEQLEAEHHDVYRRLELGSESYAESLSYQPHPGELLAGPDQYLEYVRRSKEAVAIPIIASLNGNRQGDWVEFSAQIEQAGADALELNLYNVPTDLEVDGAQLEAEYLQVVERARALVRIPLAVKLSPYITSLPNFARRLAAAGADALVLFNRFYQPDFNLQTLEVEPHVQLSTAADLRLPLRWIAILYGRLPLEFAATGGLHSEHDVLKAAMAGAKAAMLCSVLLKRGLDAIRTIEQGLAEWMETHQYESITQMLGSMSQLHCADPDAFERAQYIRALYGHSSAYWLGHHGDSM